MLRSFDCLQYNWVLLSSWVMFGSCVFLARVIIQRLSCIATIINAAFIVPFIYSSRWLIADRDFNQFDVTLLHSIS